MDDCLTVSVAEAAALLGVGRTSVYRALRAGRLPALRIGRKPRFRIPRAALERLVEEPERYVLIFADNPDGPAEAQRR